MAVYSCMIGAYEAVQHRPCSHTEYIDYYFFTDKADANPGPGWKIIPIQPHFDHDPVRSARRIKTIGHEVLAGYNQLLWVDSRVVLKPEFVSLFDDLSDSDFMFPEHSFRDSLEEEAKEIVASGYDDPRCVRLIMNLLRANGQNMDKPLWTGLFAYRNTPEAKEVLQRWWEYILLGSRRDQLTIRLALSEVEKCSYSTKQFDNIASIFHDWIPVTDIGRDRSKMIWSPQSSQLRAVTEDYIVASTIGRIAAKAVRRTINRMKLNEGVRRQP